MPNESGLTSLHEFAQPKRTAHQFVRETLRHAILNSTLTGGTRLVQADIAAQLEVSTTPVREALRDLSADGLIQFDPHHGAIVREVDMEELAEIYEIRRALEALIARKAAERITAAELKAATDLQSQMSHETDIGAWVQLNGQFHAVITKAARSPRMASIVLSLQDTAAIYVAHSLRLAPDRVKGGNQEHRQLLNALRKQDADRAASVLVRHLESTLETVLSVQADAKAKVEPATV